MDSQAAQQPNPIFTFRNTNNTVVRTVLIFAGVLVLGFAIGFIVRPFINPQKNIPPVVQKPTIDESKLPVSLSLLTNPIVYEWRGSVKGKIIKKDGQDFTLIDEQGNSITITNKMPLGSTFKTVFFDKSNPKELITLDDIPLGNNLRGDFFIFKGNPGIPVGSSFIKQ